MSGVTWVGGQRRECSSSRGPDRGVWPGFWGFGGFPAIRDLTPHNNHHKRSSFQIGSGFPLFSVFLFPALFFILSLPSFL